MSKRKAILPDTEVKILLESARRCALCYGFDGDLSRKKGQIAHIDQDSSNADEANLVYLCLEHHDEYDSTTSQSKGVTEKELREYKRTFVEAIANGDHVKFEAAKNAEEKKQDAIRGHDERLFRESDSIMPERFLREFLDHLQTDYSYISPEIRRMDNFRYFFADTGNQYIHDDLSQTLSALLGAIDSLLVFLATNFFWYARQQEHREHVRLCLHPDLNPGRDGSGDREETARYDQFQKQLHAIADAVEIAYKEYRAAVKSTLVI